MLVANIHIFPVNFNRFRDFQHNHFRSSSSWNQQVSGHDPDWGLFILGPEKHKGDTFQMWELQDNLLPRKETKPFRSCTEGWALCSSPASAHTWVQISFVDTGPTPKGWHTTSRCFKKTHNWHWLDFGWLVILRHHRLMQIFFSEILVSVHCILPSQDLDFLK